MSILNVRGLKVSFGGLVAVNNLSFHVDQGQIVSLIGPNGAGKTTVFNAISGVHEPDEGYIALAGKQLRQPLTGSTVSRICLIALITAVLLLALVHIDSLWRAAIIENYRYRQVFPWRQAVLSAFGYLKAQPLLELLVPLFVGLIAGGGGAFVVWNGARRTPDRVAHHGIGRTFQNIRLFRQMTVLENVLVGMDRKLASTFWDALLRLPAHRQERRKARRAALQALKFVGLSKFKHKLAGSLPYGLQRRLEIARALAAEPSLLLLDEPAAGMNPAEGARLSALIREIRDRGISILLIEHHMHLVMDISDRVIVIDYGNKIAEGTPPEVSRNPRVIEAYLGKTEL